MLNHETAPSTTTETPAAEKPATTLVLKIGRANV